MSLRLWFVNVYFFLIWQRYSVKFHDPCMKTPSIFIDLSWISFHLQDRWTTRSQGSMFPSSLIHLAFQIQACSKYEKHCVNAVHYCKPLRQVKHDNSRGYNRSFLIIIIIVMRFLKEPPAEIVVNLSNIKTLIKWLIVTKLKSYSIKEQS